jgi:hypothetical protein
MDGALVKFYFFELVHSGMGISPICFDWPGASTVSFESKRRGRLCHYAKIQAGAEARSLVETTA